MSQVKSMLPPKPTSADYEREIGRLHSVIRNITARLSIAESTAGATIPMYSTKRGKHAVRVLLYQDRPVLLAEDVSKILRAEGVIAGRKIASTQELYRLKLGASEVLSLRRSEIAEYYGVTGRTLTGIIADSVRSQFVGLVTDRGIEALEWRAPKFCAWIRSEAFPAALKLLKKGGAS